MSQVVHYTSAYRAYAVLSGWTQCEPMVIDEVRAVSIMTVLAVSLDRGGVQCGSISLVTVETWVGAPSAGSS